VETLISNYREVAAVDLAKRAVRILGYLWGGVDFLEDTNGTCYVLEVNSAPGMDDTTAHAYADAIKKYAEQSNQRVRGGNPRQP
jgi:glutathione synthase/RimK-type ligase-like ATP-grasp enzyme